MFERLSERRSPSSPLTEVIFKCALHCCSVLMLSDIDVLGDF